MGVFKRILKDISSLRGELYAVTSLLRSIDSTLTLMLAVKKNGAVEDHGPKQKLGAKTRENVQIGSLLHGTGVRLSEFRTEAMREGWSLAEEIKYNSLVNRKDAEDVILKAGIRKTNNR